MTTIKDVAKLAGVSVTTVSRVFNNRGYLSDEVRRNVAAAMEELDYHPNDLARSLHNQQSHIIGLIVPTVSHPFFGEVAHYVEGFAYKWSYKVLICNSLRDADKEREYIAMLRRSQVDGIIMGSHILDTKDYASMKCRVLSLDREISPQIPYICCDNYRGGELAAEHLIGQGCRDLLHISGSLTVPMLSNLRTEAFIAACGAAGIPCRCYELPDTSIASFQENTVIRDILTENPRADGVFCTSDISAATVLSTAIGLGRRVPGDLKVLGFDGSFLSALTIPQLSSIRQPIETICRYAVEYLIRMSQGELVPSKTILPVELVARESTQAASHTLET
ncbi:MAG: LacI family DNA-binding transcriptional regulator [Treponema sp.]|jgi:LacI family sucrose operon transcriptional repressor|nr:LacI family DNA-binding transcriptional regulator [Treponema sp.]